MFSWIPKLKNKIILWCLKPQPISMGEVHTRNIPQNCEILDNNNKLKFIEQTKLNNIFVETPSGYSKIKQSLKTVEYDKWEIITKFHTLYCADNHILIMNDGSEKYVKDILIGDKIKSKFGVDEVLKINIKSIKENMFDLELDDDEHVYYTNDILSHNSTVAAAFILWYGIFNFDKTVLIASRANDHAMEMIERIRFAYENLPFWIKPGVRDDGWNKHNLGFDNGSRIMSTATAENSGRGFSISLLYLDEFAFVAPNIQEAFWTSISPTLATGGSCIMTSTPNGDMDIFAEIWRGANIPGTDPTRKVGHNEFRPTRVYWDQPPDRDNKFKEKEIAKIGERRWMQEYECCSSESLIDVMDEYGNEKTIKIFDLYNKIKYNLPL